MWRETRCARFRSRSSAVPRWCCGWWTRRSPRPGRDKCSSTCRQRASTTPTPTPSRTPTSSPPEAADGPGRGGGRAAPPTAAGSSPHRGGRLRGEGRGLRELMAHDIPDGITDAQALAARRPGSHGLAPAAHLRPDRKGESVVVHAAAGGTGSLAVQLAKHFGAGRVIATASSKEKRDLALELGADVAVEAERRGTQGAPGGGERRREGRHRPGDDRRPGLRRVPRRTRPVRAPRHVRHGLPHPPEPGAGRQLMGRSRSVVGFWLDALRGPSRDAPGADGRADGADRRTAASSRRSAACTRSPMRPVPTRTSGPAAPSGSCCSTRRADPSHLSAPPLGRRGR